jgi:hypothetical protein
MACWKWMMGTASSYSSSVMADADPNTLGVYSSSWLVPVHRVMRFSYTKRSTSGLGFRMSSSSTCMPSSCRHSRISSTDRVGKLNASFFLPPPPAPPSALDGSKLPRPPMEGRPMKLEFMAMANRVPGRGLGRTLVELASAHAPGPVTVGAGSTGVGRQCGGGGRGKNGPTVGRWKVTFSRGRARSVDPAAPTALHVAAT